MRAVAGSILVLAASICVLASAILGATSHLLQNDAPFLFAVGCIPFALGVYFLFSKDKPGA
jgi:hypothetical protein